MSICLSPARAAASRRNGARSKGPTTPEGKARSAQNALTHGLCADNYLVSAEEEDVYEALEAALLDELAPEGVLQTSWPGGSCAPPGGSSAPSASKPRCSRSACATTISDSR
jgi:hypothetical protein